MSTVLKIESVNEVNYIDMLPRSEIDISRGKLKSLYKMKGWSVEQIAKYFNCGKCDIQKYIKKFNISPKSTPESINHKLAECSIPKHKIKLKNKSDFKNHSIKIDFKCECGINFKRSFNTVKRNIDYHDGILVCPSLTPYGEHLIKKYLENNNYKYEREYMFDDLKDDFSLRFDFGIFNNNELICLIEHDGKYHNEESNFSCQEYMYKHDIMKNDYCKKNNIPLLRINNYKNIPEQIESFISNLF